MGAKVSKSKGIDYHRRNALLYENSENGNLRNVVQLVEDRGADVNYQNPDFDNLTPLFVAVREGHYDIIEYLLGRGADPNIGSLIGMGALGWAISWIYSTSNQRLNYKNIAKLLLAYNADPNGPGGFWGYNSIYGGCRYW